MKRKKYSLDKLPEKARQKFECFLLAPTMWGQKVMSLHPLDWQKFYRFTQHCHSYKVSISPSEVKDILIESRFTNEFAGRVTEVFQHSMGVLKGKYKNW